MNKFTITTILIIVLAGLSVSAHAFTISAKGYVKSVYMREASMVVELSITATGVDPLCGKTANSNGSNFFYIQQGNPYYKELSAIVLTALSSTPRKELHFLAVTCHTDPRSNQEHNIVRDGGIF